jgi:hypothetical protein
LRVGGRQFLAVGERPTFGSAIPAASLFFEKDHPALSKKRVSSRPADAALVQKDQQIRQRMQDSGDPMPLDYMEKNMHWYAEQADEYARRAVAIGDTERFRVRKTRERKEKEKAHYEAMAIKMRALNQASAESAANYTHARIQSVSIGQSRGSRQLTVVLEGSDIDL